MGFSKQEHWSGLPFPPLGDLPDPGITPVFPALAGDSLLLSQPGKCSSEPTQEEILNCQPLHEEQPVRISYGA